MTGIRGSMEEKTPAVPSPEMPLVAPSPVDAKPFTSDFMVSGIGRDPEYAGRAVTSAIVVAMGLGVAVRSVEIKLNSICLKGDAHPERVKALARALGEPLKLIAQTAAAPLPPPGPPPPDAMGRRIRVIIDEVTEEELG